MQIRRPVTAFFVALSLFGGGVSVTACQAAGQDQNDGTTDDSENTGGSDPSEDNTNQDPDSEDSDDDQQDPD
jgi:hypothetical protein